MPCKGGLTQRLHLRSGTAERRFPIATIPEAGGFAAGSLRSHAVGPRQVACLDWRHGSRSQDRRHRPAVVSLQRGRSRPAPVHPRPGQDRRDREGRTQDEVAFRRATRAVLARRARAPRGLGRAPHGHRRLARRRASTDERGSVPPLGRARRGGGDAAALCRGGAKRACVRGARTLPRSRRRDSGRQAWTGGARPARACLPAEAPVALRLRAASRELRRVWGDRRSRRLSRTRRRSGVLALRARRDRLSRPGGLPRDARAHLEPTLGRAWPGARRAALRDALAVVVASYEFHGGFRLRTLAV